ncbi:MAG TPA: DUF3592 domain-containing protein [Pyrinomonadaceae bacterium]|jgi:hypothetical protein|nr:DUF3592 domain-containing protein [Pyrinomonadaceae bacterium]
MRYIAGFMMFAFFLGGIGLLIAAVKEFITKFYRMSYFRRAMGSIVKVERKRQISPSDSDNWNRKTQYSFFPVVKFKHLSGEEVIFQSETGDGGETSRYSVGQRIAVVYDVDNKLPPMINSFAGVWLPVILQAVGGIVFTGSAVMIYFAFGAKIFGKG